MLMSAAFCSCKKENVDEFDHFEVEYQLETNAECLECFNCDYSILINDKEETSDAIAMYMDGNYSNSEAGPESTIIFKTTPEFGASIPEELDFYLSYDITISAVGKDGGVLDSQSVKETRTFDSKLSLATAEERQVALDAYTINFEVKSTVKKGRISFVPAN